MIEDFVPMLAGPRKLLASLDCKELTQVHGVVDILVKKKNEGVSRAGLGLTFMVHTFMVHTFMVHTSPFRERIMDIIEYLI